MQQLQFLNLRNVCYLNVTFRALSWSRERSGLKLSENVETCLLAILEASSDSDVLYLPSCDAVAPLLDEWTDLECQHEAADFASFLLTQHPPPHFQNRVVSLLELRT